MRRFLASSVLAAGLLIGSFAATAHADPARAQLNQTLPEVQLSGVALGDAVDFLRDVSGVNIFVSWKALEEAGVSKDTPINVRLRNVKLRKALEMILTEAAGGDKLGYDIDQNVITITTKEQVDAKMFTRVYPIQDLIIDIPDFTDAPDFSLNTTSNNQAQNPASKGSGSGSGSGSELLAGGPTKEKPQPTREERAQELIELIVNIIQPDVWQQNGGKAAVRYWNGNLIVTAPRSVQEAIGG